MDVAALARSFALVRLPRVSELKGRKVAFEDMDVDVRSIPYLNAEREKARQERLKKEEEEREARLKKLKSKEKKSEKRGKEEEEKRKRKGKHERIMNEWDELQEEERLFRQYKKHKLRWARRTGVRRSEEEYEKRLLEDDDGSEEEDTLEKAWKDHQMMRNSRKMRRAKGGKNKIFNK